MGYIASDMFHYCSTFKLEQYKERHLILTWTMLILVWGQVMPISFRDCGMFNGFLVREGQLESSITYKCFHFKRRLNKIASLCFQKVMWSPSGKLQYLQQFCVSAFCLSSQQLGQTPSIQDTDLWQLPHRLQGPIVLQQVRDRNEQFEWRPQTPRTMMSSLKFDTTEYKFYVKWMKTFVWMLIGSPKQQQPIWQKKRGLWKRTRPWLCSHFLWLFWGFQRR